MAKHKYDVVATVGKYEKNGETKYISNSVKASRSAASKPRLRMILTRKFPSFPCITSPGHKPFRSAA